MKNDELIKACSIGDYNLLVKLIDDPNLDINYATRYGMTGLIYASMNGYTNIAKKLLEHSLININLTTYSDNWTALHYACRYGFLDMVKLLLNHKDIDISIKDNEGKTAKDIAKVYGYTNIVDLININFKWLKHKILQTKDKKELIALYITYLKPLI